MSTIDLAELCSVTGGRFLPRARSLAYPAAFVAAAIAGEFAARYMVKHDIGILHVPAASPPK